MYFIILRYLCYHNTMIFHFCLYKIVTNMSSIHNFLKYEKKTTIVASLFCHDLISTFLFETFPMEYLRSFPDLKVHPHALAMENRQYSLFWHLQGL